MNDNDLASLVERVTEEKTKEETVVPVTPAKPAESPAPASQPAASAQAPNNPEKAPAPAAPEKQPGQDDVSFADLDVPEQVLADKKPEDQAAATPAQPTPPASEEEPEESKHWSAATRKTFASLRTKLAAAEDQIQKLKTNPTAPAADPNLVTQTVESATKHQQEVEALRAELNKAYDLVSRVQLEADPRFKAKYDAPKQALFDQIKDVVREWDVKDDTIRDLLKASPKRRIELANEVSPDVLPLLAPILAQYDHVDKMRKMDLDRAKSTLAEQEQAHSQEMANKDKIGRVAMFKNAAVKVLKDGHFVFRQIEGPENEKWNKNVAALQAKAQALFTKDDPLAQAEHLILGVAAPVYLSLYRKEKALREDLQKQLKENYAMRPALSGRAPAANQPARANSEEATAADVVGNVMAELHK